MSEIELNSLLESLGDMTVSQAKEFLRSLGADLAATSTHQQATIQTKPAPAPVSDYSQAEEQARQEVSRLGEQIRSKPAHLVTSEERRAYQEAYDKHMAAIRAQNQAIYVERQAEHQAKSAPQRPQESAAELQAQLEQMRAKPAHLISRSEYDTVYRKYQAALQAEQGGEE
jgi:hypothetical protein